MLGPVVLVGGGVLAAFRASRALAQTLVVGGFVVQKKRADEAERLQRLDINPMKLKFRDEMMAKILGVPSLGASKTSFRYFRLEAPNLPQEQDWAYGEYLLTLPEMNCLLDGLRHDGLGLELGEEAERLLRICRERNLQYSDFSFLWEGHGCDFPWLKKVSAERLKDAELRSAVGLPPV